MYPKLDIENINKIENSLEGQKYDIKRIIKIIRAQTRKSFKIPFSNNTIKHTFVSSKFKTTNPVTKSYLKGDFSKKSYKDLTLPEFIYFFNNDKFLRNTRYIKLKSEEKEKQNLYNRLINMGKTNNLGDDNFFKTMRDNGFLKKIKTLEKRKIKSSKNIHINNKINKSNEYNKKYKNDRYSILDKFKTENIKNCIMNSTFNYITNQIKLEDKTIQINKHIILQYKEKNCNDDLIIDESNKYKIKNFKKKSFSFKNNKKVANLLINTERMKNSDFFSINNYYTQRNHYNNVKALIQKKYNDLSEQKEYKNNLNRHKNQCINIYTLLSLKKNKIK